MKLYTLGHSNHDWTTFQRLLEQHGIGAVADVRSRPRSRLRHFSAPNLRSNLNQIGVAYIFLGDLLGGMPATGPDLYEDMATTIEFRTGIARVREIMPRTRLAICCSEHDVLDCHRFLLVSRHLADLGIEIEHLHRDGTVETHFDAEQRLLARTRVQTHLFENQVDALADAYRLQELRIRGKRA